MRLLKTSASAPGKVILFGEHAVVYGATAIAAAVSDLRIFVDLEIFSGDYLYVIFEDILVDGKIFEYQLPINVLKQITSCFNKNSALSPVRPDDSVSNYLSTFLSTAPPQAAQGLQSVIYLTTQILPDLIDKQTDVVYGIKFVVRSVGLPIGAGLGSSAAFSVALAGALIRAALLNNQLDDQLENQLDITNYLSVINEWSYCSEMLIHGKPSGIDNYTSCYGGLVKYVKSDNRFELIDKSKLPQIDILLINTKVPRSTKQLVSNVRELSNRLPRVVEQIVSAIDAISIQFIELIDKQVDIQTFYNQMKELITINHRLLQSLGVSHPSLERSIYLSESLHLASKLTGAGGGGCAITLLDIGDRAIDRTIDDQIVKEGDRQINELKEKLVELLRLESFDSFESSIGGAGIIWYNTN